MAEPDVDAANGKHIFRTIFISTLVACALYACVYLGFRQQRILVHYSRYDDELGAVHDWIGTGEPPSMNMARCEDAVISGEFEPILEQEERLRAIAASIFAPLTCLEGCLYRGRR